MVPVMELITSLRTYEVIEPSDIRGLVFDGPASQVHPRELTVSVTAFGVTYTIELERVDDLFSTTYGHYSWDVDAERVIPPDEGERNPRGDHCHYRGVVRTAVPVGADVGGLDRRSFQEAFTPTHTRVRASLCDGMSARIVADDAVIHLEPAHRHLEGYAVHATDAKLSAIVAYRDGDVRDDAPRGHTRYVTRPEMVEVDAGGPPLRSDRGWAASGIPSIPSMHRREAERPTRARRVPGGENYSRTSRIDTSSLWWSTTRPDATRSPRSTARSPPRSWTRCTRTPSRW